MAWLCAVLLIAIQFADVPKGHWAAGPVESLRSAGILVGYPLEEKDETYGKTHQQILEMGREKWSEFFVENAGPSTAAMSHGEAIFGRILKAHNTLRMAKASPRLKTQIEKLRRLLPKYGGNMIGIASAFTGGGTMWIPVYSGLDADTESVIDYLLGNHRRKAPAMTTSKVARALDELRVNLKKNREDIDSMAVGSLNTDSALKLLSESITVYHQIVSIAKQMSRTDSDRILNECLRYILLSKA